MGCGASKEETDSIVVDGVVLEAVAPKLKPKHWGSAAGVCIVQDATCFRMQELLDRTWRVKYTKDRKHADPTGKVPIGGRVITVVRVENHRLFNKYARYKASVRAKRNGKCAAFPVETDFFSTDLDADVNEMYLFHGTNPAAAIAIARHDFDMARIGSAVGTMFGPGIYLAECATKSDEYAKKNEKGNGYLPGSHGEKYYIGGGFALLLCRAVAGQVNTVQEAGDTSGIVKSGFYDSICGDRKAAVGTFREMIFFSAEAVYCEYIIIYSRVFDDDPNSFTSGFGVTRFA